MRVLPDSRPPTSAIPPAPGLARRLGLFDATMIVMGGIVGAGIFINPYVVAQQVHTPALILAAWAIGGLIALAGAFIYAELAAIRPRVGGQYAYLREAYHPLVAFLYGWTLLLVVQSGGMAAVAVTFSRYFLVLSGLAVREEAVATAALAALTAINCFGVRSGSAIQSALMVLKIGAIVALVAAGLAFGGESPARMSPVLDRPVSLGLVAAIAAAMVPVLFAYGGGASLFVFRRRTAARHAYATPGHPLTTGLFATASALVVLNTIYRYPENALIGVGILLAGVPVFFIWRRRRSAAFGSGGASSSGGAGL